MPTAEETGYARGATAARSLGAVAGEDPAADLYDEAALDCGFDGSAASDTERFDFDRGFTAGWRQVANGGS